MSNNELLEITGLVEDVVFRRDGSGWSVIEISSENELITVVGEMPEINVGEQVTVTGNWTTHPTFGRQFSAQTCQSTLPTSSSTILRYLASGAIKGIGPVTAEKLVATFGDNTLSIIENEPQKLCKIKGITINRALKISEELKKQFGSREVVLFLSQYGIGPMYSLKAYKVFGLNAVEIISESPFMLCKEQIGVPFMLADKLAEKLGKSSDYEGRINAGILYILRHNLQNGHTCLPANKVIDTATKFLCVNTDIIEGAVEDLIIQEELICEEIQDTNFLFLPYIYRSERYCAGRLKIMCDYPPVQLSDGDLEGTIKIQETLSGIQYEKLQRKAVVHALSDGLLILTGGPGTGKTTTLRAIIELLEQKGQKVVIAAPTGRAAKRISEVTGKDAKTIHRLLEVEWTSDEKQRFARNEHNKLKCDALIIDEFSMVDILLFEGILRALPLGSRLIMVGDSNQLPAIGAGNVLNDLIESDKIPVVELKEVFRQALESLIVENAHKILHGEMPELTRKDKDFFFISNSQKDKVQNTIIELCSERLPKSYNLSPFTNIQVLCPSRKGELGTVRLNEMLQKELNPPSLMKKEIIINNLRFREGDKVMQIRNNYDISWTKDDGETGNGIFNGDVGVLEKIDKASSSLFIRFDDKFAIYTLDNAIDLEQAYAVTVHKSQGSEFEAVVMPVYPGPSQLYYRNLLYTAVTRARSLLVMVGLPQTLKMMVDNNKKAKRYTALSNFLKENDTK